MRKNKGEKKENFQLKKINSTNCDNDSINKIKFTYINELFYDM